MALIDEATKKRLRERMAGSLSGPIEPRLYRKPGRISLTVGDVSAAGEPSVDELSQRLEVQGVPRTVVNRAGGFVGALPEERFVESALQLAGAGADAITQSGGDLR